jgi:hypothetical protein
MARRHAATDPPRARAAVRWGVAVYFAAVAGLTAAFDCHPELYDFEYGTRLTLLRARQAETPDRPLLLVVGSSRTVMAFAPEQMPPMRTADGTEVLPFNFGHFGAGPIHNLMDVSRMFADGVRPRWVFLELMPTFVAHEGMQFLACHTAARDFPVMHGYMRWHRLYGDYAMRRLSLAPKFPGEWLRTIAPDLALSPISRGTALLPLGGCTFLKDEVTPDEKARQVETTRSCLQSYLGTFEVSPQADAATRHLLNRLRAEGILTVLLLTPEGSLIRTWYRPGGRQRLDRYCADLSREFDVPVVDAREWLADADMTDFHHTLRRGAEAFTARLGREVIAPFVATGDTSWAARLGDAGPVAAGK